MSPEMAQFFTLSGRLFHAVCPAAENCLVVVTVVSVDVVREITFSPDVNAPLLDAFTTV